jgi:plasmid stability protein
MASFILRDIDDAWWRQVKAQAALEGISLKALVTTLLRQWLKSPPRRAEKPIGQIERLNP